MTFNPGLSQEKSAHLSGFALRVAADQKNLHGAIFPHREREGEIAEGVKGHRDFGAFRAHQRRFEKAVENVYDDRVVPPQVIVPRFFGYNLKHRKQCTTVKSISRREERRQKSVTAENFLTESGRPSASFSSRYGFFFTRFRSSWRPSRRKASSSWESCCWYPENCGANRPTCV